MKRLPKTRLRSNGALVFRSEGFHGGRMGADGNGIVEIEVFSDQKHKEIHINLYDPMSSEDGHYSPISLSHKQAKQLRDWLDWQMSGWEEGAEF